ncbi:terminase large subunit [Synechococcus phage ACG-2014e]|uniref:Terminase large subunit n=5 Tax=Kyanoviridae TaxID=2946160 RepID=A0A1D8KL09_9CAUD|nr:terminase large subunit [Synechococcus phage ACG-2014e]YP_009140890.1 terminase large subunit [Synechococcus phage ACG-2014i]YP_009320556.1 terminase large subunit [Synechococcus phage S-CAM4]YP_010355498.1 terminase large subunit [Synechococcus phage ACG-2014j]YP_010355720.1 terminase large subunit [Synechococcus phage ACG-2014e]AIX20571.1 terminase large subunit [Synechococcus phage ACG-2014e]AIX26822.1 terminase large subunit [Synechococcus phage ACG-2014i]AIX28453.1 terminase large su
MATGTDVYLGNPNLKKAGTPIQFTKKQIDEWIKCKNDPIYFAMNYIKIISLDEGLVPFEMYDFQKKILSDFHETRFNIAKLPRQTGKSTTVVAYLLYYAIFYDSVNIGILANKASTARELLGRLQLAYENLPKWMQHGVLVWNKGNVELENGSKILAASTSASAVRGMSFNILFLDEFAFVPNHVAEQFFASVYPTITSGKSTKVIIISTPNGMNHFYKMWEDARRGKNDYTTNEVHWSQVPGRDAKWKEETIKNTSPRQFAQEFECDFLGSADTLISPAKLQTIPFADPIKSNAGLDIYERVEKDHEYIITVDVARGIGGDYSAFLVFDITTMPYKIVAKYRNNEIKPILFPSVIFQICKEYNNPYVLVEVNDIGDSIAATLNYDLEYPNVLMCAMRGRAGQVVGQGFSGSKTQLGVKMSVTVKKIGCSNLKAIIEEDKLIFNDFQIFQELTTFVQKKQAWEADEGYHDDLVMCMVLFAWLVMQEYFKEMTDQDIRRRIYDEQRNQIEQDMAPFGFLDDGMGDDTFVDGDGNLWEYGDKQEEVGYMWNY